jgi:3-deoxy-D-manno-octulosonic acid kinase
MTIQETFHSYKIGSLRPISDIQKMALIREFHQSQEEAEAPLSGRVRPQSADIHGLGRLIVKHYYRGGVLRHLNRRTYLNVGKTRSAAEFEALTYLRSIGLNAPEPVAFASLDIWFFFYHAWLVLKEIPSAETLAKLSLSKPSHAESVLEEISKQIRILIDNGILHVDLHPGNVLVDADNNVFLIDFDKVQMNFSNHNRLALIYTKRWRRSILKHNLPLFLLSISF